MSRDKGHGGMNTQNNAPRTSNDDVENEAVSTQTDMDGTRSVRRLISSDSQKDGGQANRGHIPMDLDWQSRVKHFTWSWFTVVMSTGGVANVIHAVPYRFPGLFAIGVIFQLVGLTIFVLNCAAIAVRFYRWPSTFVASFTHPTESLFVPAFMISIATILVNAAENGLVTDRTGPWLASALVVLFWIYVVMAVVFSTAIYIIIWSTQAFTLSRMTPVWIFPAYPLLLVGPLAGVLSTPGMGVPKTRALEIIAGGVMVQGMGFLLALTMHATYVYRLMSQKLPEETSRPAMFISVGPSSFTVNGLIMMGRNIKDVVSDDFMGNGEFAGKVSQILAYWAGVWLFGIAILFFSVALGSHWFLFKTRHMHFTITWNAFIFPNTGFITAIFAIATVFNNNQVINIIGCVFSVILVLLWLLVMVMLVRSVIQREILWPHKQEDSEDHYLDHAPMRRSK